MKIPDEQAEVAAFLTRLAGRPAHQTHISAVFIGPDTVWKLKKAVRMPFLDFSTLAAREHFLRRELELNRRAAPSLYRDVVPIGRRPDGSLALGVRPAVDFVLRMARVPDGDFLDEIAAHRALTPVLLDQLGDCVAAYHAESPVAEGWDLAAGMLRITEGNHRSALAASLPEAEVTAWRDGMVAAIEARHAWFAARQARRCHGDLHLGNICLWGGKPVPFDALEFDEALATIDPAYDLGFLLMDLDRRVDRAAANRVMNRYTARTADLAMAGYPVFLSQRAFIRAFVLRSMDQEWRGYLDTALDYLRPSPPQVLAIGGLQGTGKSTLARALAPALGAAPGAVIVRSDEIRKWLFGMEPESRLPPDAYTDAANAATNRTVRDTVLAVATAGHAVIADTTFLDPTVRAELEAAVRATSVPFLGVWLQAPLAVLEARVAAREGDASDATVAVLRQAVERDSGPGDWLVVDATDAAAAERCVLNQLSR